MTKFYPLQAEMSTSTAQQVMRHLPMAGLFGSNDVKSSYSNFHQLKANDIDGKEVNFADLQGKVGQHVMPCGKISSAKP